MDAENIEPANEPQNQDSLVSKLRRILNLGDDHHQLHQTIYDVPLTLLKIKKSPMFLASQTTYIQAFTRFEQPQKLNPYNIKRNQFYGHFQKHSSPHSPCYEALSVKKWSVRIVNISQSGNYAPILILHDFRSSKPVLLNNIVQKIFLDPSLKLILDNLRVEDMKQCTYQIPKSILEDSLFASFKGQNIKQKKVNQKADPFISLDFQKKILNYKINKKVNYIPIGKIQGNCKFLRPISDKFLNQHRQMVNFEPERQTNFIDRRQQNHEQIEDLFDDMLWSDSEEERVKDEIPVKEQSLMDIEDDEREESEDDDDDILKKLYQKNLVKYNEDLVN